ncbi:MAG TPA: PAS domain-containing sensor histidine kinase, partial [Azospirillaceae bacterium]|nr:PAS domain-containing sensor histidine kinase [Azospirillaceae bacterium]
IALAERGHAAGTAAADSSDEMGADEMGKVIDAYNRLLNRLAEDEAALAAERNLLQTTLDNIDQGVLMVDAGLRLVMHNRRAAALLGVTEGFLAARPPFADLVATQEKAGAFADSLADFDLRPDGAAQALAHPLSFKRRLADGSVLEVRSRPLAGGGFVRTLTDVTAETSAAEDMVRAMEKLESAYRELKDTQDSLIQAEKMASLAMLVTGVAHEINTPVGIALGCAGHLSAKTRELADALGGRAVRRSLLQDYAAQAEESSRLIQQNLARAAALIQSFKAVAVDHTSQERRVFDLAAYLGEVAASLAPRAREAGARVAVACPPGLTLDSYPGALAQIIANLIVNALIHGFDGRSGGMVRLTAAQDAEDADWVRIVCADDGCGVPPEHLPRLFEPFFTTKRGAGGSGLGLHIAYNLATQTLGGRIAAENGGGDGDGDGDGGGAVFTLRLPKIAPTADKARAGGAEASKTEEAA